MFFAFTTKVKSHILGLSGQNVYELAKWLDLMIIFVCNNISLREGLSHNLEKCRILGTVSTSIFISTESAFLN